MTEWPTRTATPSRPPTESLAGRGGVRIKPAPRRIRLGSLVGGLFLMFVAATAFLVAWDHLGGGSVVVVTRDVPAGHVLQASDLDVANVKGTGDVPFIPGDNKSQEVGRPAAVDLVAGQPLLGTDVGNAPTSVGTADAVVAVALQPGQFPPGVAAGDRVLLLDTTTSTVTGGTQVQPTPSASVTATVLKVEESTALQGGQKVTIVSLRVPASSALDVARAGAAGHASLALLKPGS